MPPSNPDSYFIAGEYCLNSRLLLNSFIRQNRIALYYVQYKCLYTELVWFAGSNNVFNLKSISFPL